MSSFILLILVSISLTGVYWVTWTTLEIFEALILTLVSSFAGIFGFYKGFTTKSISN